MTEEILDILDESGRIVGQAPRSACHKPPGLPHRAVHVIVRRSSGALLLQLRSTRKDIQPGKWDTSVGGHVQPGESVTAAAAREVLEELGFPLGRVETLYEYRWNTECEKEWVTTFLCDHDGPVKWPADEIDDVREWSLDEIRSRLGSGCFTPNFEVEFGRYMQRLDSETASR